MSHRGERAVWRAAAQARYTSLSIFRRWYLESGGIIRIPQQELPARDALFLFWCNACQAPDIDLYRGHEPESRLDCSRCLDNKLMKSKAA